MFQRANRSALVRDPTIFWWFHHVCDIAEQRGPGSGGPSQGRESRPQPWLRQSLYTAARPMAEPPAARATAEPVPQPGLWQSRPQPGLRQSLYRSPGYGRAGRSPGYGRACIPQPGLWQSLYRSTIHFNHHCVNPGKTFFRDYKLCFSLLSPMLKDWQR